MKKRLFQIGFGLVEILIAMTCFLFAIVPLIGLFSFNLESAKNLEARSFSLSAAQELVNQIRLIPANSLPNGVFPLTLSSGNCVIGKGKRSVELSLSSLPPDFQRSISISENTDSQQKTLSVEVISKLMPTANLEMSCTLFVDF
ncbi:MAG: hypothetical protein A2W80_16205 [Candidatus Riflebacteria bacterium GWC2_50_8]|nr:MAG: hypothetical protein A2W80_16205 [Candidatus Riflebacteria bacterium GWC2_50_8]